MITCSNKEHSLSFTTTYQVCAMLCYIPEPFRKAPMYSQRIDHAPFNTLALCFFLNIIISKLLPSMAFYRVLQRRSRTFSKLTCSPLILCMGPEPLPIELIKTVQVLGFRV